MKEDATVTEPTRIAAKTRAALEESLCHELLQRSRGSYWLGEMKDNAYTIDVHHSYYVREPGRTQCVHDAYPRLLEIPITSGSGRLEAGLPSVSQVRRRFDAARELDRRAIKKAVTAAYSPLVAVVGRTAGHLGKFENIYYNYLQAGRRLYQQKDLLPEYIVYLEGQGIIEGDDEHGYVLTKHAVNDIKDFRKRFPELERRHSAKGSSVPFLSMCLEEWEFLGEELHLTTIKSYFRLLMAVFDHHFRAKAEPDAPDEHPIALDGIIATMRRHGWGKPTENDLRPRLRHLAEADALEVGDDYVTHMRPKWYARGHREATEQIGLARQTLAGA